MTEPDPSFQVDAGISGPFDSGYYGVGLQIRSGVSQYRLVMDVDVAEDMALKLPTMLLQAVKAAQEATKDAQKGGIIVPSKKLNRAVAPIIERN